MILAEPVRRGNAIAERAVPKFAECSGSPREGCAGVAACSRLIDCIPIFCGYPGKNGIDASPEDSWRLVPREISRGVRGVHGVCSHAENAESAERSLARGGVRTPGGRIGRVAASRGRDERHQGAKPRSESMASITPRRCFCRTDHSDRSETEKERTTDCAEPRRGGLKDETSTVFHQRRGFAGK